jgi:hypothetical protein
MVNRHNTHIKYRTITILLFYYLLQIRYYRSTITQESLNGLTILRVEKKLLDKIYLNNIIDNFVS